MDKRGVSIGELGPIAIAFVFVAVVLGIGATILSDVKAGQTADSTAANASQEGLDSLAELSSWLPLVALVIAAAVVIGILSYFKA